MACYRDSFTFAAINDYSAKTRLKSYEAKTLLIMEVTFGQRKKKHENALQLLEMRH
jgi:hypothetical protein